MSPPYDSNRYRLSFPFFEQNGESFLNLLGRDEVVKKINLITLPNPNNRQVTRQKYWPIVISTSRGMGKTFLLKMIGMQKLKPDLQNELIKEAGSCGRILSFDFAKDATAILSVADTKSFFPRLMVYFLCLLFDGKSVDGINFEKQTFSEIRRHQGRQKRFNDWLSQIWNCESDSIMDEYIRLTNIAFAISPTYKTPPVFLLDEIQSICQTTNVPSGFNKNHTFLSLLLTELAGQHRPICICTGTNDGTLNSITEKSAILPQVLSLTPLVDDCLEYWNAMTIHKNQSSSNPVQMENDMDMINSMVYASYQIPRLLYIAHQVWFTIRELTPQTQNREFFIQAYENEAIQYYKEMSTIWSSDVNFSVADLSHIILSCGVHWAVEDLYSCVPGTTIQWNYLIRNSLIFPYLDNCYLFPFHLVWNSNAKMDEVEAYCSEKVKNVSFKDLFLSYDSICRLGLYQLGMRYESLFASSLAVKYYLWKLLNPSKSIVPFCSLYDFGGVEKTASKALLKKYSVDFSEGLYYPSTDSEAFTNQTLPQAVVHNRLCHNAHHDIILPTELGNIAVSAKASFTLNSQAIEPQWFVSKASDKRVVQLIWLYLGSLDKEEKQENLAFLDGSGVCNGLAIDMFVLVKKLKSLNQQDY